MKDLLVRGLPLILAGTVGITGIVYATTAASGADAHGYLAQADTLIHGHVRIEQPWAAAVPWPAASWTFSPLGYRPSSLGEEPWTIVPIYPPGLPMLFALARVVGGQEAVFWVVPLAGAMFVLATASIARRLISPAGGIVAAWLVATSPAFLFMLVAPMSDVPVAAAWAVAFACLLERQRRRATLAGGAIGMAILIRPNLAPLAAVPALWYLVPALTGRMAVRREARVQGALFSAGVAAGGAAIATFFTVVNGSPLTTGYGSMTGAFAVEHVAPNAALYLRWLVESHTPVVLFGMLALVLPLRWLWPAARERLAFIVIGLFVAALWIFYWCYLVFDAWWYLRFLLPSWPFLMAGVAAAALAIARRGGRPAAVVVGGAIVALGVWQVAVAADRHVFDLWKNERRYVSVAREVRRMVGRASVVYAMQHSGSVRYYGGRLSVRYDTMADPWIDRSVDWLAARGIRSYLLVDDWEVPLLRERFAGRRLVERLDDPPLLHYIGTSEVFLYDLSEPRDPLIPVVTVRDTYEDTRSVAPVRLPPIQFDASSSTLP